MAGSGPPHAARPIVKVPAQHWPSLPGGPRRVIGVAKKKGAELVLVGDSVNPDDGSRTLSVMARIGTARFACFWRKANQESAWGTDIGWVERGHGLECMTSGEAEKEMKNA